MPIIRRIPIEGYELVVEAWDEASGLHCFIAIHDRTLGPALGGARIFPYHSHEAALYDALRLAKGMTYKSALARLGLGGGKAVIIADPKKDKTEAMLTAFGEVINALDGGYITAEDVGSTVADIMTVNRKSPYVVGIHGVGRSGDPGLFTAYGTLRGMHAVAQTLWNSPSLRGIHIAIQGLGSVGRKLAEMLFWEGAELTVCDIHSERVQECVEAFGAKAVAPEAFSEVSCDILSPCALGGTLNAGSIPLLRCKAVAGSANNQLENSSDGHALMQRQILYAPDFVINAGGVINAAAELSPDGYFAPDVRDKVDQIYNTLLEIFASSLLEKKATNIVADELAERQLREGAFRRQGPLAIAGQQLKGEWSDIHCQVVENPDAVAPF